MKTEDDKQCAAVPKSHGHRGLVVVLVGLLAAPAVSAAPANCPQSADERAQLKAIYQARSPAERDRMLKGLREQLAFAQRRASAARAASAALKAKGSTAVQAEQKASALERDVLSTECAIAAITP